MSSGATRTALYFAYGSNLWSERIRLANKTASFKSVGLLQGYRLEFGYMSQRWKGAAANIYPDPNSHVYGVLWEINVSDLENLDIQEGVKDGIYERIQISVTGVGENTDSVGCWAYKITKNCRDKSVADFGEQLKPSVVYKNVIIRGAKENKLPSEYITYLENIPDNGYDGEVNVALSLKEQ